MRPPPGRERRQRGVHRQRKTRYVDETLQKWLLVGLVALEAGLVGGLAWLMRWQLNQTIEQNLYRVHQADAGSLLGQLLHQAVPLVGLFLLANALALVLVHLVWRRYLHAMLRRFMTLIGKTRRLDFSLDPSKTRYRYGLLTLTEAQRTKERHRLVSIREQMDRLEAEVSAGIDLQRIRNALDAVGELLPPKPSKSGDRRSGEPIPLP